jgi:hypothetical protein
MPNNLSLSTHIEWHNNLPRVVGKEVLTKQALNDLNECALTLDYNPIRSEDTGEILPSELRFVGKMNAEVAAIKRAEAAAQGDDDIYERVLDRVLGKPKQSVETKSMTMTYQDYLDTLPEPPSPEEREAEVLELLALDPNDSSPAQAIRLRKLQYQSLADDL